MSVVVSALFVSGLVVFIAATLLFYVRLYRASVGWGVVATLLPPVGLVPLLAYFRKHALAGVLILVGAYAVLVNGVLWLRMHPENSVIHPQSALKRLLTPAAFGGARYVSAFPDIEMPARGAFEISLRGSASTTPRIEWAEKMLRFTVGGNNLPVTSLEITLPDNWNQEQNAPTLTISPSHSDAPVIKLVSIDPTLNHEPAVTVIKAGYWLELDIVEAHESVLKGHIKLVLPNAYQTWVVGDFVAHPEGIRYVGGELDRRYDSPQTLARVGISHVNSFLWRWMEGSPQMSNLRMQTGFDPATGQGLARVNLGAMGNFDLPLEFRKGESGWYVIPDAVPMIAASIDMQATPTAAGKAPVSRSTAVTAEKATEVNQFEALRRLVGQRGELQTLDGRRLQGKILEAEGDKVRLMREVAGNRLAITVSETNFLKFVPES